MQFALNMAERGVVPDAVVRMGIRGILKARLRGLERGSPEANRLSQMQFIQDMRSSPIALNTGEANEQHYEVPAEFFQRVQVVFL